MENEEDPVKKQQTVDVRARNISHNVRCLECGSQSIEESQADIVVLLRKLICDEIKSGKNDKDIYKKLEDVYGETMLYAPKFDWKTAALWLSPNFFSNLVSLARGNITTRSKFEKGL
ncbi:putative CcmH/CycL/Ccl2/NrfF family protein [Helianthus anomalus]